MGFWSFLKRKKEVLFLYNIKVPVSDGELSIIGEYYDLDLTNYQKIIEIFEREVYEANSLDYQWKEISKKISNIESTELEIAVAKASLNARTRKNRQDFQANQVEELIRDISGTEAVSENDIKKLEKEGRRIGILLKQKLLKFAELGKQICSRFPKSEIGKHLRIIEDPRAYLELKELPILRIEK